MDPYNQSLYRLTRRFSNHVSRLISRSHTYAIVVILDLKIHQSMWIHWLFFPKTWTKGHWPLDDLWPHVCWGHMCDATQGSLCPRPMTIHQCMWIQWSILQNTTYIHTHTTYILRTMYIRVIHEKSNVKCLTSSSLILFILVIKYIMQNFSNFEKRLEGATGVLNFVHKVNRIFWSFLFRGPNMMMINLNVAKKLLDMCVLMLQNQSKKKKKEKLITILRKSQFSEFLFNWCKAIHGTAKTKFFSPWPIH